MNSAKDTWLAGRYDNPMPELALSPSKGPMNSATEIYELGLGYMAGWPVRQPQAGVDFIPQSGIYEFG
jgi:hypothetical protein